MGYLSGSLVCIHTVKMAESVDERITSEGRGSGLTHCRYALRDDANDHIQ